jgi:hypothetical protein
MRLLTSASSGGRLRTLAGNYQLFSRLPALLSRFHNPSWFEVISRKTLNCCVLCVPGCCSGWPGFAWSSLCGLYNGCSGARAATLLLLAFGQLCFYGLAMLGPRARKPGVSCPYLCSHELGCRGGTRAASPWHAESDVVTCRIGN